MSKLGNRVSSDSMLASFAYKSTIAPRSNVISRKAPAMRVQQYGTLSNVSIMPIKTNGNKSVNPAVSQIQTNRDKEKRDLSLLNDKFAQYVERVRFLEVHNKKLEMELESLESKMGQGAEKIREMYMIELDSARQVAIEMSQELRGVEKRVHETQSSTERARADAHQAKEQHESNLARINELNDEIRENEREIHLLRRRLDDLNDEMLKWKAEAKRLIAEIQRVTKDLDNESLRRIQAENDKKYVQEELNFLAANHTRELETLREQILASAGLDISQFFRSELASAIQEIRDEYEASSGAQQAELDRWFRCRTEELQSKANYRKDAAQAEQTAYREQIAHLRASMSEQRSENATLRANNAELEARIEEIDEQILLETNYGNKELNDREHQIEKIETNLMRLQSDYGELLNNKQTLVEEIHTYARLLEGDSNKEGLKQVVQSIEDRLTHPSLTLASNSFLSASNVDEWKKETVQIRY